MEKKPGTILSLSGLLIFNLFFSYLLITGADFLRDRTKENVGSISDLTKQTTFYLFQKLYYEFSGISEWTQRDEDSLIIARQNQYNVYHYDLSLSFDIPGKSIEGRLKMAAGSLSDTLTLLYMNLYDNMKVSSVVYSRQKVTGETGENAYEFANYQDVSFKQENDYVIITLTDKPASGQEFAVIVSYSGKPKSLGFDSFSFKNINGNPVVYNLSEPTYGPVWWPSKDNPDDKALSILRLKVPPGLKGVSNGLLSESVTNPDGTSTFTWVNSYPISTYLVSIVVGKFAYWEDTYTSVDGTKQMPVVYYVFPEDSANTRIDWKNTPEMIGFFGKTFGEYPFINEKYGMVQFGWTQGAMEHQTITSMGYLLVSGDNRYEAVVVHELAHQWFGDAVTLKDWKNIWLNEGFATYAEALWEEYKRGKDAYLSYMRKTDYGYFSGTVYSPAGFINSPAVYATIYQKGGWVLHMLRGVIGDEPFFKGLREYYERFKYKNAETSDFRAVMEEVSGQDLSWFFSQWVYDGTGRPRYEYSWRFETFQEQPGTGAFTVHLRIEQKQDDLDVYKMPVRIRISTENGSKDFTVFNDKREQSFILTVDSKPKDIILDPEGWILKKTAKGTYK